MAATTRTRSGFGEILRRELETKGVSTRELARRLTAEEPERLDNMRRTLIRYIQGSLSPRSQARDAIAAAIDVDPAVFAESAVHTERRNRVLDALKPLADVLLELAIEVAAERQESDPL